jgi:nicotinamide riboside kinase
MKTTVISLFGGPGTGKSTVAAGLFSELKLRGKSAELVQEYVKSWAWRNIQVGAWDQLYILGKQAHREAVLYGKVEFIVTDCPLLLSGFYEQKYSDCTVTSNAVFGFIEYTKKFGVDRHNFWLTRQKKYDPNGRYQTEAQATEVDSELESWLVKNQVPFEDIRVEDGKRVKLLADLVIGYHSPSNASIV